jgi:hypothetical protein
MIKYIIPLILLGLALSSYADSPTGKIAGKSGCYAVSGALDFAGLPTDPPGAISGDVVGTFVNAAGPPDFHGAVVSRPVRQTWEITGGIVEPLFGKTVVFENDFTGILAQLPIIHVNTTMRVAEGAKKGNLTLHGWTDVSGGVFVTMHLEYHGVICP